MNLFSSDAFLELYADVYFPGRRHSVENFRLGDRYLRALVVDGKVVRSGPFFDFLQPMDAAPTGRVRPLDWAPLTVVRTEAVEDRTGKEPDGLQPSPFILWSRFGDWAAFEEHLGRRVSSLLADTRRCRRRVERELGPLTFRYDDRRPEALAQCLAWKSAQYTATGLNDLFAQPPHAALFGRLHSSGVGLLSTLSAGDRLIAAHIGAVWSSKLYWWIPSYDGTLSKYSPGRLLLHDLLKESLERGHAEFDFLIGDEAYKFHYATHNRVIGELGTPPVRVRLERSLRARAREALATNPRLLEFARRVRRDGLRRALRPA